MQPSSSPLPRPVGSLTHREISGRYGPQIRDILTRLGQHLSIADHPDTSDNAANTIRRQGLAAYRGYPAADVFTGMPPDVAWHHAALTPAEVGAFCSVITSLQHHG